MDKQVNIINVRNTEKNATLLIKSAIEKIKEGAENIILFEAGKYYFYEDGTTEEMCWPSNNKTGLKKAVFLIQRLSDVVIDANNSEFIFCDRVFPFILNNSKQITIKNLKIDFSFPVYANMLVTESTEKDFTLQIQQKDLKCSVNEDKSLIINAGKTQFNCGKDEFYIKNQSNNAHAFLITGDTDYSPDNLPAKKVFADAELLQDDKIRFSLREGSNVFLCEKGNSVMISYDQKRENDIFFIDQCENISLVNVSVYRGAGMGVIAQTSHNISVIDCFFKVPDYRRSQEKICLTADILHFVHCTGTVLIENCTLSDSLDDAVNIHGVYTVVKRVLSDNEVEVQYCHKSQDCSGTYSRGDILKIYDKDGNDQIASMTVADAEMYEDRHFAKIRFYENIDFDAIGCYVENQGRMPVVIIKNNILKNCPSFRLSSSKYTYVGHNLFELNNINISICDLMQFWYESGYVDGVYIENNVFSDTTESGNSNGIYITQKKGKNVFITGNTFKLKNGRKIAANGIDGILCKNNTPECDYATELIECRIIGKN